MESECDIEGNKKLLAYIGLNKDELKDLHQNKGFTFSFLFY
jgi:hypothetical protein